LLKNDITGNNLISKPANDKYRENWERIFSNQYKEIVDPEFDAVTKDVAGPDSRFPKENIPHFLKKQAC